MKKTSENGRIFLSYRREDSSGYAGRLFDRLAQHFGKDRVFMDISDIEPGVDFVDTIEKALSDCDAFLVLIGKTWSQCRDEQGRRRLDNPDDFIRLETATALKRNVRVIPVLVKGAMMPTAAELPTEMAALARRHAQELSDLRWDFDCENLLKVLDKVIGIPEGETKDPASAPPQGQKSSGKAIAGLVLAGMLLFGFGVEEVIDTETAVGLMVLALLALILAIVGYYDIRLGKVRGKGIAIGAMVLSSLLFLAAVGSINTVPSDVGTEALSPPVAPPAPDAPPVVPALPLAGSSRQLSQEPLPVTTARPLPPSEPEPEPALTVGGRWRGNDGLWYDFEQEGDTVAVAALDGYQNRIMTGAGSFTGPDRFEVDYQLADGTFGQAGFSLSDDGRRLQGRYHNLSTGVSGAVTLQR